MKKKVSKPKKKTARQASSKKKSVSQKARAVIDEQLAALSPALKKKLEEVKGQIPVGDLRSLGMNVLERARVLSEKLRQQAKRRPAMQKGKNRASGSSKAKKK